MLAPVSAKRVRKAVEGLMKRTAERDPPAKPFKRKACRRETLKDLKAVRRDMERQDSSQHLALTERWIIARCENCRACLPR